MENVVPFKVNTRKIEIVQVDKDTDVPKGVREGRWGEEAVTYKGKIYLFKKNPSKYTLEHEKAHVIIKKEDNPTLTGVTAELDDEVKADLYTYHKIGKPQSISKHLHSRAGDTMMTHMVFDKGKKYNYYQQTKHMLYHIQKVYKKYWEYLPEQWKKDYNDFVTKVEKALSRSKILRRNTNPPGDYVIDKLRDGSYDIKRVKVIRKNRKKIVVGLKLS